MTITGMLACGAVLAGTVVDFGAICGKVKPVNGVGQPPMIGMPAEAPLFHYLGDAGIPYSRLHDVGGVYGQCRYVDIPNIFKDFSADENDPKNYSFEFTDILMKRLAEQGVEPIYRLGVTIENTWEQGLPIGWQERIRPPKDFAKWARICEHVIRHYTEGWADGFHYRIERWEIWNEPDNRIDPIRNPLWQAPFSEFIRFYGVVAPYLKEKFPHLKIGGYGSCGFYAAVGGAQVAAANSDPRCEHFVQCAKEFLEAARANKWPLDFFSYHSYSSAPMAVRQVAYADELLDSYGFTRDRTERIFDEWLPWASQGSLGSAGQAAQIAAELIGLQNGPCDIACIYDARCGVGAYSPLFNCLTFKPFKAYAVFKAFNELRKLGSAVKPPKTPDGVFVAAATDGRGRAAMLLANIGEKPWTPDFELKVWKIESATAIDTEHDGEQVPADGPVPVNAVRLYRIGVAE